MSKGMGGMPGNMQALMKQAQKMQADLQKAQAEAENYIHESSAGGGVVKVTVNGKYEVTEIKADDEVKQDPDMLIDLIQAAVNQGLRNVKEHAQNTIGKITGGTSLGGLF